jgi:hypothetical protein
MRKKPKRAAMRLRLISFCVALAFVFSLSAAPDQNRIDEGEFKGFSRPTVEIINSHLDTPIYLRVVRGTIRYSAPNGSEPLSGVIVEIRGPGDSTRIRGTKTNSKGEFGLTSVPEGTYVLKTTLEGYQSYATTVVVTKKAGPDAKLQIELPLAF